MNDETLGLIAVRAANRQYKSCKFKRAMLERLAQWHYDINAPAPPVIGGGWLIAAHLSANIQWPEEDEYATGD